MTGKLFVIIYSMRHCTTLSKMERFSGGLTLKNEKFGKLNQKTSPLQSFSSFSSSFFSFFEVSWNSIKFNSYLIWLSHASWWRINYSCMSINNWFIKNLSLKIIWLKVVAEIFKKFFQFRLANNKNISK